MMLIMAWKPKKRDHRLTPWLFFGELSQITQDYGLNQFQLLEDCQGGVTNKPFLPTRLLGIGSGLQLAVA